MLLSLIPLGRLKPAATQRRPRKSAAATVAFAAIAVLRFAIASCLLLKSGGKTAALQNMGRSCDRGASLKAAATFWALRWPAAVLPAVLRVARRLVLRAREIAVRLPARAHLRCLRVLLGAGVRACGAAGEGHQRDVAGALDGYAEPALVARADAGHAARENLAALLHELREDVGALVVDEVHLLDAELADFLLAEILALAARASAGTARSTGAAFATRTAVTATGAVTAAVTTGAFAARCAAGGLRLLLWFICHNCLPFHLPR